MWKSKFLQVPLDLMVAPILRMLLLKRRSNFNQISKLLLGNLMIFTATADEVGIDGYDEKGES